MSEEERLTQRLKMLEAAISLGLCLWCLWSMIPEHRRQLARMRILLQLRQLAGSGARRAGAASMAAELSTGQRNYVLPYSLSLVREQLGRAYDRARGVTP